MVEIFCSGDHGTLTDYEETPEGVRPVLTQGREAAVQEWGLPLVWRTVDAYVDALPLDATNRYLHVDAHLALTAVMRQFWEWPTRAEVDAWSSFPWEVGQGRRQRIVALAGPFRLRALATSVARAAPSLTRSKQAVRRAQRSEWLAASIAMSNLPARALLRPRATARDLVVRTTRRGRATAQRYPAGPAVPAGRLTRLRRPSVDDGPAPTGRPAPASGLRGRRAAPASGSSRRPATPSCR